MRIKRQNRPTWSLIALVTLAAAIIAATSGDKGYGWPFVAGHFMIAWVFIGAFAMLGKALFGRR